MDIDVVWAWIEIIASTALALWVFSQVEKN
jgi:hypothetical protein